MTTKFLQNLILTIFDCVDLKIVLLSDLDLSRHIQEDNNGSRLQADVFQI